MDDNVYDAVEKVIKYMINISRMFYWELKKDNQKIMGLKKMMRSLILTNLYTGAFDKEYDFVVRRDTFGWMTDAIRNQTLEWFNQGIPVFCRKLLSFI